MVSSFFSMLLFFPSFILIIISSSLFLPKTSAQISFLYCKCGHSKYTSNSKYHSNLNQLLKSFSSSNNNNNKLTHHGFYNLTFGQAPDKVEATALCRGDIPPGTCRACVEDSAISLPLKCPNEKVAFGYTEYCIIFYTNDTLLHTLNVFPDYTVRNNENNISYIPGANQSVYDLMNGLKIKAAKGDSKLKYAVGELNVTRNASLYGLVQCNPDLSREQCLKCVDEKLGVFPQHIVMPNFVATGEKTMCPSCNLRYEMFKFYGNVSDVVLASPPTHNNHAPPIQGGKSKKLPKGGVIAIAISGSMLILIVASICVFLLLLRRRKLRGMSSTKFSKEELETLQSLQYSFGDIKAATSDFSINNKLGQGGFGTVYKGQLLDGRQIAVKRLSMSSGQGDGQFENEVLLLAKLQHRNLVKLLGFCLEQQEMILIYEFLANTSLDHFITDKHPSMEWETRFKIIDGIAKGLLYLHEDSRLRIIHRDLKAGNVLLDGDFNPKIADFGMARLFNIDQSQAVASKIVGTYGYMPPEYVLHGHVSMKLDVYSFGVLVLEIVSGHMISSFHVGGHPENLLAFAWKNWEEGTAWNIVDPRLSSEFSTEILRCIHIGLLCVQNLAERPTMSSVILMLSNQSPRLEVPSHPAIFTGNNQHQIPLQGNANQHQSNDKLVEGSINEVTVTDPYPR